MVPLSDRDKLLQKAFADPGLRQYSKFIHETNLDTDYDSNATQMKVLMSIVNGNSNAFAVLLPSYTERQFTPDSDWIQNDCLIFLLLLGCHKFGQSNVGLEPVLAARERNSNPVAIKTNQAFRAILRNEFAMEGDYCFLKVVFLKLVNQLNIPRSAANSAYTSVTQIGLLDELPQFLQVIAIRAFDVLVLLNAPSELKTFDEVAEVIHKHAGDWSFAKTLKLFFALPNKILISLFLSAIVVVTVIGGAGYKAMEYWLSHQTGIEHADDKTGDQKNTMPP